MTTSFRRGVPGYRSCGQHGDDGYGNRKVNINCPDCILLPKAPSDRQSVRALRTWAGVDPDVNVDLEHGEQMTLEARSDPEPTSGAVSARTER